MSEKNKRKCAKSKPKRNCYNCENCIYIGEGGYICARNNNIVIEEWQPTDEFYSCDGKGFEKI